MGWKSFKQGYWVWLEIEYESYMANEDIRKFRQRLEVPYLIVGEHKMSTYVLRFPRNKGIRGIFPMKYLVPYQLCEYEQGRKDVDQENVGKEKEIINNQTCLSEEEESTISHVDTDYDKCKEEESEKQEELERKEENNTNCHSDISEESGETIVEASRITQEIMPEEEIKDFRREDGISRQVITDDSGLIQEENINGVKTVKQVPEIEQKIFTDECENLPEDEKNSGSDKRNEKSEMVIGGKDKLDIIFERHKLEIKEALKKLVEYLLSTSCQSKTTSNNDISCLQETVTQRSDRNDAKEDLSMKEEKIGLRKKKDQPEICLHDTVFNNEVEEEPTRYEIILLTSTSEELKLDDLEDENEFDQEMEVEESEIKVEDQDEIFEIENEKIQEHIWREQQRLQEFEIGLTEIDGSEEETKRSEVSRDMIEIVLQQNVKSDRRMCALKSSQHTRNSQGVNSVGTCAKNKLKYTAAAGAINEDCETFLSTKERYGNEESIPVDGGTCKEDVGKLKQPQIRKEKKKIDRKYIK